MEIDSKIDLQYQGFLDTKRLWKDQEVFGFSQYESKDLAPKEFSNSVSVDNRLGKRVEQFVFHALDSDGSQNLLLRNHQIVLDKLTIGEIDCVLEKNDKTIHIEIVYKFYLYDSSVGDTELDHWIGPNRNDTLLMKLGKLKEKQFPLLYHSECINKLESIDVIVKNIEQQVMFFSQLFVPWEKEVTFELINKEAVCGYYIKKDLLSSFNSYQFYIPGKLDWLVKPTEEVEWLDFEGFNEILSPLLDSKRSTLCWFKNSTGELQKFFVVWW